ncbi:MAG: NHL repeat-containing protein [Gemmatimonadaceae bacterium]
MRLLPRFTRRLASLAALSACAAVVAAIPQAHAQQPIRWALGATPRLTLGADEDDANKQFSVVVSATRLADGSVLVGDRADHALRLFSPAGELRGSFARRGGGPGEVRYLGKMWSCADSVYTYDIEEGHRISVFTLYGRYVRTFRFGAVGAQVPYATACNSSGDFVHLGWESDGDMKPGAFRSMVPVWMSRADEKRGATMDSVPGSERWGLTHEGRFVGTRPRPLGKQAVIGIGRNRIYIGSADRFQVRVLDFAGRQVGELVRTEAARTVTKGDIRGEIERAVATAGENERARLERSYAAIEFPTTLPAYTTLLVDESDFVWVRPFARAGEDLVRWSVFSPTGSLVAEVDVPAHLEVFEIGRDYVLGRYLDPEEAIPQVRVYGLERGKVNRRGHTEEEVACCGNAAWP